MLEHPVAALESMTASLEFLGRLRQANHERSGGLSIHRFRTDSMFGCKTCGDRWPVFVQPAVRVLNYRETRLSRSSLGSEERRLDQTLSDTDSRWTMELSQEWVERIEIVWERLTVREQTVSASARLKRGGLEIGAAMQRRLMESLRSTHSLTSESKRISKQTVEYTLPARTLTVITTSWKQLWQEFECDVVLPSIDDVVQAPYRLAVDVTFDQQVEHFRQ
jgi:hypothetical protein